MKEQKSKQNSSLKQLAGYVKPHQRHLFGVIISLLITSLSILMIGKSLQFFIDNGLAAKNTQMFDKSLTVLFSIVITLAIFTFIRFYLITKLGELVIADIRKDVFAHLLTLSPSFFEDRSSGEIVSRINTDSTLLLTLVGSSISVAMRNAIMLVGGIIMLALTNFKLTMIIFALIPIVLIPILTLGKRLRKYSKNAQDRVAELSAISEQAVSFIRTIQAYVKEDFENNRFQMKIQEQLNAAFERITLRALLTAVVISLAFGGIVFVLWIGGHKVINGTITPGQLSSFVFISVMCAASAGALSEVYSDFQKAAGATERLFEFFDFKPEITDSTSAVSGFRIKDDSHIEFKNVTFHYKSNHHKNILKNLSFIIEPKKVTALVGKSGSGKSTIFSLLERFYDRTSGDILIGNTSIDNIPLKNLRSSFTYITQDAVIFSGSVRDNIAYSKANASDEEIINAAKAAEAWEFIEKLPEGLDTYLGEKGVRISGGQKQRIAIARAILHDPKILLLDEATSSLDTENEAKVQEALKNLMKNRTTIIIAHRLTTVRDADKIIVLSEGNVREEGTHDELVKLGGLYKDLASRKGKKLPN